MEPQHIQRRIAAILAADVAGYSRLTEVDEEGTHARLKAHRRELIDPKIKEHHGRIVKTTGDGVLVEFPSVVEAVRCAVEVQQGMAERNANTPKHERIEFRVGINLGDIIVEEEDIYGDGVNIAARLESLAQPGSVYISGTAFDQVQNKIALRCKYLGAQRVKNIAQPVRVYRIRSEPRAIATAPRRQGRTGLVAGTALLIAIGLVGAAYIRHHSSLTEGASIPPGPKSEAQGATAPTELPKEMPPLDAQVWEEIRSSTNPADFEAYLRIFPNGAVADLARERLRALALAPQPSASTTEPTSAAQQTAPQQNAIATESAPPPVPAPQPPASMDAPSTPSPTLVPEQKVIASRTAPPMIPVPKPPARTTGPTSASPPPTPKQKAIGSRSALPPVEAPQPPDHTDALTTTTPAPAVQQPVSAGAPTTAAAPAVVPQQQAMIAPDVSKSVTTPGLPSALYDGEWKGSTLGAHGGCIYPACPAGKIAGNVKVTVAKNAVSGKMEIETGNLPLTGAIANDGSFAGKLGDISVIGKFDEDRFKGIISGSPANAGGVLILERVK